MILYISGGKLRASWRSRRTSFLAGSCAMSIHRRIHKEGGLQPDNQNFKKCEHHFYDGTPFEGRETVETGGCVLTNY